MFSFIDFFLIFTFYLRSNQRIEYFFGLPMPSVVKFVVHSRFIADTSPFQVKVRLILKDIYFCPATFLAF
jgi:hypothetical protein